MVSVQSGTLDFTDGANVSASAFTVAAGATLEFADGTFTLSGGTYSAAGKTLVAAGDFFVDSAIARGTAMMISGGTLELALNSPTAIVFAGTSGKLALDHLRPSRARLPA